MPLTRNKRKRKIRSIRKIRGRKTRGRKIKRNYRNKRKLSRKNKKSKKSRRKKMKKRNRMGKGFFSYLSRKRVKPVMIAAGEDAEGEGSERAVGRNLSEGDKATENHDPFCTICQQYISFWQSKYRCPQGHIFHTKCINTLCKSNRNDAVCPICRENLNCNITWKEKQELERAIKESNRLQREIVDAENELLAEQERRNELYQERLQELLRRDRLREQRQDELYREMKSGPDLDIFLENP